MAFAPGDRVHLAGIGTGTVREARSGDRYAVNIKGRVVVAAGRDLEAAAPGRDSRTLPSLGTPGDDEARPAPSSSRSIDLHGKTVAESVAMVEAFIDDALREGQHEVRIIHGKGSGRVKAAVHHYLRQLSVIAAFRVDPDNPGSTIVTFA